MGGRSYAVPVRVWADTKYGVLAMIANSLKVDGRAAQGRAFSGRNFLALIAAEDRNKSAAIRPKVAPDKCTVPVDQTKPELSNLLLHMVVQGP